LLSSVFGRFRKLSLASAAVCLSALTFVEPAAASTACNAINAGFSLSANAGTATATFSPFDAGETITFTLTRAVAGQGSFRLSDGNGKVLISDPNGGTSTTYRYAVIGNADKSLEFRIVSTGTNISLVSFSCAPSIPASARLRAMQVQLTPQVAMTSGAAITGAIDTAIADAFSSSVLAPISGVPGVTRFNLQPAVDERERIPAAFDALNNYVDRPGQRAAVRRPGRDWSIWAEGRGTRWSHDEGANEVRSTQINVTAGLSRKLGSDALVGLVMGYEDFRYDVPSLDGNLKGHGWTLGAYGALRFSPQMRVDGTLAWSKVNYDATAGLSSTAINGTANGVFSGDRLLASTGVTGIYPSSGFILEPSARIYVLWEQQAAWTDSLSVEQAAREFTIGRVIRRRRSISPTSASTTVCPEGS
jgi:hypothetical protein